MKKILESKSFKNFETFVKNNKLFHAYLILSENEFSGKMFCKAMALKLMCETNTPCFECKNCKSVLAGFNPDLLIYPQEKSTFLVGDSNSIIENVDTKPMQSRYKIFVVNNIDNATVQAENKLLKTIEDSPKNVIFLFNAVNKNKVLQTIISRTQILEIENFENLDFKKTSEYEFVFDLMKNMKSSKNVIKFSGKFAQKSVFLKNLLALQNIFEQLLFAKVGKSNEMEINLLANEFTVEAITEICALITLAQKQFDANVNTNLIADNLLIKILEVKYLWNLKK
ncbi:MAG: hypothetical protein PHQ62_01630 [Clostridia bacterium]|nr:hypothetical protein [Clostridia bacterium]